MFLFYCIDQSFNRILAKSQDYFFFLKNDLHNDSFCSFMIIKKI